MRYDSFVYIYPPRPTMAIKPKSSAFEGMKSRDGWTAQLKLNGQRNMIYIYPSGEIEFWNRRKEKHRNYTPPEFLLDQVRSIFDNRGQWMVIDGELLHAKDRNIKNTLYVWDILVCDDELLIGKTLDFRYNLLLERMHGGRLVSDYVMVASPNIWVASNVGPDEFDDAFEQCAKSYVEGLMFKDINAKLQPCFTDKNNSSWQVRCRRPHGAYRF